MKRLHFLVWDPVVGDQRRVAFPPAFRGDKVFGVKGAVICAAGDQGHVHGACHSSPFQVVLLGDSGKRIFACVYSSETGAWGNLISILWPPNMTLSSDSINTLVGNSICWVLTVYRTFAILEFDLDRQSLAVIEVSQDVFDPDEVGRDGYQVMITPAHGGGLGFLVLSGHSARLWKWKVDSDGVARWVLRSTVELKILLPQSKWVEILGLAEDDKCDVSIHR